MPRKGQHLSKEAIEKLTLSRVGKPCGMTGKHHSEEAKDKIRESKKHLTSEARQKMSLARLGKPLSEETKIKISNSLKGKLPYNKGIHYSEAIIENMRLGHRSGPMNANYGKLKSEETKEKIRKSSIGKHNICDETRQKMIKSHKGKKLGHYPEQHRMNISKALRGKYCGERSPNWMGGIANLPHTYDFNDKFKMRIKERDGCCLLCNLVIQDLRLLKRQIQVHHVDYDKLNSFPQNCVTLCTACHMKTNYNRTQWTSFFHSLLKERYGYQYTEDQKIILDFTN